MLSKIISDVSVVDTFVDIIFLDIDGVLQPFCNQKRFKHDLDELKQVCAADYDDQAYLDIYRYDLGAVYYDWDTSAVARLKRLCETTKAKIVISSNWRLDKDMATLKRLFRIHGLDSYIIGVTPNLENDLKLQGTYYDRWHEVSAYLSENSTVRRYVILDDNYVTGFKQHHGDHFVQCVSKLNEDNYDIALGILLGT